MASSLRGQAEICKTTMAFVDTFALKCVIELRVADIIHSHGRPITLSQIASGIDAPSCDIFRLERVMRLLVHKNVFSVHHPLNGGDPVYGLTDASRWLVSDDSSIGPLSLAADHPYLIASWHFLSAAIKEGGIPFNKAHGRGMWETASQDQEFNRIFNEGMACHGRILINEIVTGYKDGFASLTSLVDVGGGIGGMICEIVKAYPHIKGINFDLPHVISTAPIYDGVTHMAGDMFQSIPKADAIFLKWILHNWGDDDCVKILKNCKKAIPEGTGKVIIADIVLREEGDELYGGLGFAFDLLNMAYFGGGKERTEPEWKKILEEGGFSRFKIIKLPSINSIIEAYPDRA